jgi:hypothetical protein
MLEVMIKAGRAVKKGDEVLFKEWTVLNFLACKILHKLQMHLGCRPLFFYFPEGNIYVLKIEKM